MKKISSLLICLSIFAISFSTFSQTVNPNHRTVKTYTKKSGTVVQKHEQTVPNKTKKDNYSTKGNINPNTGKKGTKK